MDERPAHARPAGARQSEGRPLRAVFRGEHRGSQGLPRLAQAQRPLPRGRRRGPGGAPAPARSARARLQRERLLADGRVARGRGRPLAVHARHGARLRPCGRVRLRRAAQRPSRERGRRPPPVRPLRALRLLGARHVGLRRGLPGDDAARARHGLQRLLDAREASGRPAPRGDRLRAQGARDRDPPEQPRPFRLRRHAHRIRRSRPPISTSPRGRRCPRWRAPPARASSSCTSSTPSC